MVSASSPSCRIGTDADRITSPVSRPWSICMMQTPLTASPASMARWMGQPTPARQQAGVDVDAAVARATVRVRQRGRPAPSAAGSIRRRPPPSKSMSAACKASGRRPRRHRPGRSAAGWPAAAPQCCGHRSALDLGRLQAHPRPAGRSGWVRTRGRREAGVRHRLRATAAKAGVRRTKPQARASRCSLRILVWIRLRLRMDRYSTNTLPSRWSISCCTQMASVPRPRWCAPRRSGPGRGHVPPRSAPRRRRCRHRDILLVDPAPRAGPDQFRVDQHQGLVALLRDVDHDHTFVDVDLRGGQPDALGVVHGLQHVGHQRADTVIDLRHRLGHLEQTGSG